MNKLDIVLAPTCFLVKLMYIIWGHLNNMVPPWNMRKMKQIKVCDKFLCWYIDDCWSNIVPTNRLWRWWIDCGFNNEWR